MRADADEEFTAYAAESATRLRRTAYLLCGDWQRAEDELQAALVKLYLSWHRVRARGAPSSAMSPLALRANSRGGPPGTQCARRPAVAADPRKGPTTMLPNERR